MYVLVFSLIAIVFLTIYVGIYFALRKLVSRKRVRVLVSICLSIVCSAIGVNYVMDHAFVHGQRKGDLIDASKLVSGNTIRNDLMGKSREEIVALIGKPSDTLSEHFFYDIEAHESIAIKYLDGKVVQVYRCGR